MHKLLFFSRVAFICNCSYLLGFVLRYYAFLPQSGMASTIIILGFVAPALNFFLVVVYMLMSLRSKKINPDDPDDHDYDTSRLSRPSRSKEFNLDYHDYDTSRSSKLSRSKHSTLIAVNFCFLVFQLISLLV